MTVGIVVVAAGSGTRLGADLPKAFVSIGGRTLLGRALTALCGVDAVEQVVVAAPAAFVDDAERIASAALPEARVSIVVGGAERQESVRRALRELDPGIETVLVHDAARAFAPAAVFSRVIERVRSSGCGVVPVLPVVDTVLRVDGEELVHAVDRSVLRAAQTPQGFPRAMLVAAHERADDSLNTDDAGLVQRAGGTVVTVPGDPRAHKITTPDDYQRMSAMHTETRVGTGTDTHAFDADRPLWLAGITWPGEVGLAGHSDADVVCHAIVDALLSAAGLGDIGSVFGTSDPRYDGASGLVFIDGALKLLRNEGWEPVNVAVQVIGNRPKLAPRRLEAQELLTEAVGASVSLSATTTDGLGYTGRGEGLAAIATALISRTRP